MAEHWKTITLKDPLTVGGEVVAELNLAKPRAKHMLAADDAKGDMERLLILVSQLSGLSYAAVQELALEDLTAIGEVVEQLVGNPKKKGGKTS